MQAVEFIGQRPAIVREKADPVPDLSSDVSTLRKGERVLVYHRIGCGRCVECRAGSTNICQPEIFSFVQRHNLPLSQVITHRAQLADAPEMFRLADSATAGKIIFQFN
jgi:threonine dehydrogenase-like Zn-dependent dehydrogenase